MKEQMCVSGEAEINHYLKSGWHVVPGCMAAAGWGNQYSAGSRVWAIIEREVAPQAEEGK